MPSQDRAVERQTSFWLWTVFVAGTAIYLWLLSRSWVGRDQIILLNLGQGFALTGTLHPVAKGMSGGGLIPGSLLEILIGGPLMIWQDYRAPLIPIAIFALLAGVIVYRVAKVQMRGDAALIYFLLYWLSPWRLTHAAMMWEPAFLFLPAALHLWAASRLTPQPPLPAGRGGLWPSVVLGGVLLLTPQLHGSFLFLWLLTAILIYRKEIRLDWRGAALGAAIGSLTLIPAIYAAATGNFPAVLPQEGFIGKGFVTVWPLFKGALYWLRLASLDCGGLKEVVYFEPGWAQAFWQHASVILLRILQALTVATIAFSVLTAWWYFRKRKASGEASGRNTWLERYAWYAAAALVLSAGFSPVTLQGWHVTIALHAALIPLAVWAANQLRTNRRRVVWFGLYLAVGLSSVLAVGLGKGSFRRVALPREVETVPAVRVLLPATLPLEAK